MRFNRTWNKPDLFIIFMTVLTIGLIAKPASGVALGQLSDYAFVASRNSSDVAIISTNDDQIVGKLSLAGIPSQIVASESRRKLIALHGDQERVSLVDLDDGRTTRTLDLGFRPDRLQIDDKNGVVAISGTDAGMIMMLSIDQEKSLFINTDVPQPTDLMFDRNGERLYVAERGAGVISIIDARQGALINRLTLEAADDDVVELIRTPGGKTGLALHGDSGLISALALDEGVQVGSSRLPGPAHRGFPSANSQYFLIPNGDDGSMSMVSSWTYQEAERFPAPERPIGVNFAMFDTIAFAIGAASRQTLSVSLMDDRSPIVLPLPGRPETSLTVDAGKKVYVALSDTNQVAVLDASTNELTGLIDNVGDEPWAITAAGGLGYCH